MQWTMVHVPAMPAFVGYEVARIRRSVSTEVIMAELDRRLAETGLATSLSRDWLVEFRAAFEGNVYLQRVATPGEVYDPDDAERTVAEAIEKARSEGVPRPYLPSQTGRWAGR